MIAKVVNFTNIEELLMFPSRFDVYLLDIDVLDPLKIITYCKTIKEIDDKSHVVYFSANESKATLSTKAKADYFFTINPFDEESLFEILTEIKKEIRLNNIIVKIPKGGEKRIKINNLNYINIVKRYLCYHLKDGTTFNGQTLRGSFEKAINPLQNNKSLLFLSPSLLINLEEIKEVYKDRIIFENDEVLYVPLRQNETILSAWKNYNILD